MAMSAGFLYALGNVTYGIHLSRYGFWAAGFTGPINLLTVLVFRSVQACMIKKKTGKWVDYKNSNYWSVIK
jgi:hypothetical protein